MSLVPSSQSRMSPHLQEKRLASVVSDGKRNPGSGSKWYKKGDVRWPGFLVEAKMTGKKSMTLSAAVLGKIRKEAIIEGRTPILAIHLGGRDYILLEEGDFLQMLEDLGDAAELDAGSKVQPGG